MAAELRTAALAYLCQRRFHQSIICPITEHRISFALCGPDWSPSNSHLPTVLYCLPSSCTRYAGILFDGLCRKLNFRLIAIDRPGCGATPMCPLEDRLKFSTIHTESVLEYLYKSYLLVESQPLLLLTHSAGILYALQLLVGIAPQNSTRYFGQSPRWLCSSAAIPTSISKQTILNNLPTFLLNVAPIILPGLAQLGMSLDMSITWLKMSSNASIAWSGLGIRDKKNKEIQDQHNDETRRDKSKGRYPNADFWPPYHADVIGLALANTADGQDYNKGDFLAKIGFEMMIAERFFNGAFQDFKLCLGRAIGFDNAMLEQYMLSSLKKLQDGQLFDSIHIKRLWAQDDAISPPRGQAWLERAMKEVDDSTSTWYLAQAGHDQTLSSLTVLEPAFQWLISGGVVE